MIRGSGFTLKRAGGLTGLAGIVALGGALMASQSVAAGGNPDFEGIVSAASPTGFMSSPAAYDISGGPVTVDFDVASTNLTSQSQTVALQLLGRPHPHVQRCWTSRTVSPASRGSPSPAPPEPRRH